MKRLQWASVVVVAALLAAVPVAHALDEVGLREPLRLLQAMTGTTASFTGNITTTARYCTDAACTSSYAANDGFGTYTLTGPVGGSSNWTTAGSISTDDYLIPKGGIKNTATGAACSSNTGAVCVNDADGLAGANSGSTTWTISAAGAAVFNAGSTIGSTGTAISALCAASATLDFASSLVTACSADLTINLACATVTSPVALQVPNVAMVAGSHFQAWVSSAGVISIRHCCLAGTSCDPASGVFAVRAIAP